MTAAPEIPADVMAAAREAAAGWPMTKADGYWRAALTTTIARAILAERQRCVDYVRRSAGCIPHRQEIAAALERGDVCDVFGKITRGNDT